VPHALHCTALFVTCAYAARSPSPRASCAPLCVLNALSCAHTATHVPYTLHRVVCRTFSPFFAVLPGRFSLTRHFFLRRFRATRYRWFTHACAAGRSYVPRRQRCARRADTALPHTYACISFAARTFSALRVFCHVVGCAHALHRPASLHAARSPHNIPRGCATDQTFR